MEQGFDLVHTEEIFTKEDDVGFHHADNAALGAGGFGIDIAESFQNMSAVEADCLIYLSVNVVNVFIAGFFVESVDILGNDGNFGRIFVLQTGNCQMSRIGFGFLNFEFELVVEIVYQCRIALEAFNGGDVFDAVIVPQAVGTAKGGQSGFRRNSRAGQNDDVLVLFVQEALSLTDLQYIFFFVIAGILR